MSIHTGHTASLVSSDRPSVPISSLASSYHALSKLLFVRGIFPSFVRGRIEGNTRFASAEALMKRMKLADNDDFLLMIAGTGED